MSMTREEAVDFLSQYVGNDCYTEKCQEAHSMAVSAIRPVTRERVEKVWRGEWVPIGVITSRCTKCNHTEPSNRADEYNFCPHCGAPMTDEAVDKVLKRLEALNNETD